MPVNRESAKSFLDLETIPVIVLYVAEDFAPRLRRRAARKLRESYERAIEDCAAAVPLDRAKRVKSGGDSGEVVGDAGVAVDRHALRFPLVRPVDRRAWIEWLTAVSTRNAGEVERNVCRDDDALLFDSHPPEFVRDAVYRVTNRELRFIAN